MADVAVGLPFSPAGTCHTGSIQWDHPLTAADSLMATYRNLPAFVLGNLAHSQGLQGAVVHWLKVAHSEGLLEGTVVLLVGDPGPPKQPTFLHWLLPRRRLPPAVVAALKDHRDRVLRPSDLVRILQWLVSWPTPELPPEPSGLSCCFCGPSDKLVS